MRCIGLDDLCVRFIINLPKEELESVERICFQVEEAQWFYEDFIRPLDPELPSLNLRNFCLLIFQHCPMLSTYSSHDHAQAFSEFLAYKTRVPVRGAILLNEKMDEVLLVKGWKKGANWSFPRGKINKDEPDLDCAVREVYEETGYDINDAGLVPSKEGTKYIEMNLREQHMRLYVFRGVPMDTYFEPRTRKEISKIQWWKLGDLPTLKKKKQQQDGQGVDLAINANKFYMVAPFLPQLKKWISAQRKLDKTRETSISAPVGAIADEVAAVIVDHELKEDKVAPSINGDMGKLLEGLRQSAQPTDTSDSPAATGREGGVQDIAAQLKNFLGVPIAASTGEFTERPPALEPANNPKADSLLALLQSKPAQPAQMPQTPMEQVIKTPKVLSSPPRLHHQPQSQPLSSMPPPPSFPSQDQMTAPGFQRQFLLQPPQARPIPPPQQPAQIVARNASSQSRKPPQRPHTNKRAVAPYQRTGDPEFAQNAQVHSNQSSLIPRANKLPPPKLNAQSSALLDLFKTSMPPKSQDDAGEAKTLGKDAQQTVPALLHLIEGRKHDGPRSEENIVQANKLRQTSNSTSMFVPSQVRSRTTSEKALLVSEPTAKPHENQPNSFRNLSADTAKPVKPATPTLQLPSAPIELSALPTTPGHSREPSRVSEGVADGFSRGTRRGSEKLDTHSRQNAASLQNPPVSATINGPLNIPQFDMIAKASKEAKQAIHDRNHTKSPKRSPVRILTRPTSSHEESMSTRQAEQRQEKAAATKPQTFITPVKKPPPTPDLKAHEAPPKAFQPQILRRPAHLDDSAEPSPIQPLPSPKHSVLVNYRTAQPGDQKKSLLSLFTKPSPAVSPPSTVPVSAIDPSALISPLTGPSPKEQADVAFARLSKSVGNLSHEVDKDPGTLKLPPLRTGSVTTAAAEELKTGRKNGRPTPAAKTTPVDKAFLLGFLNSVAEGGR